MEIVSRKETKERALRRYFTGKPCKRGHIAERNRSKASRHLDGADTPGGVNANKAADVLMPRPASMSGAG
jgi:hypothetical protein